jgi:hypothetical protein
MGIVMDQQDIVAELSRLADQNARLEAELSRLGEERIPAVDRSSRRHDRRLTLAYVLVTAVVVGLTAVGSASALDGSNTVFSDDIVDGTVSSYDLKNNTVITSDIKDNSIASRDIADGTITGPDVGDRTITSANVDDETLTGFNITDGSIYSREIADGSINGNDIDLFNDNRCTLETLLGTAQVNADPAVPSTNTTNWISYPHSCSGQQVQVRRVAAGNYSVEFGNGNPARLAEVTENTSNGAQASAVISVEALATGQFYIQTKVNGSYADVDFTIVVF